MIIKELAVKNRLGLHARSAALVVQVNQKFESNIVFEANGCKVNAKSIMGIIMLAVNGGGRIKIYIEGKDEEQAIKTISELLENKELDY